MFADRTIFADRPKSVGPSARRPAVPPTESCSALVRLAAPMALAALAGAAVLGGLAATRLAAARDRIHHRRAREVLNERSADPEYPWP